MNLTALQDTFDTMHADAPGGAGLAVIENGEAVCVRSGGQASPGVPWSADTMIGLASATKAMASASCLLMIERGLIHLDQPVAAYWPEFTGHGKGEITVRCLLAHRSGVVTTSRPFTPAEQYAHDPIGDALADAEPDWPPCSRHGYHAWTFGWLISGLLAAATGRTVFEVFEREIADPYGLDLTMRLTESQRARVATAVAPPEGSLSMIDPAYAEFNAHLQDPTSLLFRATFGATTATFADVNDPYVTGAPDPSGGGHGTALGLAGLYAALVTGFNGKAPLLSPDLVREIARPHADGLDEVLRIHSRWGLGFMLPGGPMWPGEIPGAFGHGGASGSLAFIDVRKGLAFAYTPSAWQGLAQGADERAITLLECLP